MFIDFTRRISKRIYALHKLGVNYCMKFFKKVKKALTRLSNPSVGFVSLVFNGANKNPFIVEQSAVQAVPNFSPVGSNNYTNKRQIEAISIYHPTEEVNLSKSLIDKVESLLGVDISTFNMEISQSVTLKVDDSSPELEWVDLDFPNSEYLLRFGVKAETAQVHQSSEIDEFSKNNEEDVIVTTDMYLKVDETHEETSCMSQVEQSGHDLEDVVAEVTETAEHQDVGDVPELEVAETEPKELGEVVDEEKAEVGVQEKTEEVTKVEVIEQSVNKMTELLISLTNTVSLLTDKVSKLELAPAKEQSAELHEQSAEVIHRILPSSSGATVVESSHVNQSAKTKSFMDLTPAERAKAVSGFVY